MAERQGLTDQHETMYDTHKVPPSVRTDSCRAGRGTKAYWWDVVVGWRWTIVLVMLAAICIRVIGVAKWSLWEDEETTIFFSANLDKAFPKTFPLFFVAIRWLYDLTGVSYAAGRLLAGLFGVVNIWLTYILLKKHLARDVGVVAALLLALCLGHVFWSQSIRYYTLMLMVQTLAVLLFFDGLEEEQYWKLIVAAVCLNVSMLVHFSAILLVPVWVGYLIVVSLTGTHPRSYGWRGWLTVGIPTLLGMVILLPRFFALQQTDALGGPPEVQEPLSLLIRIVAYYGVPMVGLALLAPFVVPKRRQRPLIFLAMLGSIPLLELMILGRFQLATALWYHGFVAIIGVVALAGVGLTGLRATGLRHLTTIVATGTLIYYGVFLGLYYTEMQGDRPRWREAAAYVQRAIGGDADNIEAPVIFATVPGVVAHYLGVAPGQTMGHPLVSPVPKHPPQEVSRDGEWYLVKKSHVSDEYEKWFLNSCELKASFKARTGLIDRTVLVYFRPPSS